MPTGYTCDIYDNKSVSAKDYIMKCARAFGACVSLRDEPLSAEIPEFVGSTFYRDQLEETKVKLSKLKAMTIEEIARLIDTKHEEEVRRNNEYNQEKQDLRQRYMDTIKEVEAWQPPTPDHTQLKSFALKQLRESIDFDCHVSAPPVKPTDPTQYLADHIKYYEKDIERYAEEWEKEQNRVANNNLWIKQLRESLKEQ